MNICTLYVLINKKHISSFGFELQVYNGAGSATTVASKPFVLDDSPPVIGKIYQGSTNKKVIFTFFCFIYQRQTYECMSK